MSRLLTVVSGTRLWARHEILDWATETGRLVPAEPDPVDDF